MPTTRIEEAICPSCDGRGLDHTTEEIDLPYMGRSLEIALRCQACGYRHNDFVLVQNHEPTRYRYEVRTADDMMVRVVRSASGTIRIPELGILIEPGVASEAFISNIEGIIVRVERVLDQLFRDAETPELREKTMELQAKFDALREGKGPPATVILEDPFGNSAILGERAIKDKMTEEEAGQLKVGMLVYRPDGSLEST